MFYMRCRTSAVMAVLIPASVLITNRWKPWRKWRPAARRAAEGVVIAAPFLCLLLSILLSFVLMPLIPALRQSSLWNLLSRFIQNNIALREYGVHLLGRGIDTFRSVWREFYGQAIASDKRTATWTGRIDGGEKIMATTILLGAVRGETASALRFSTSLEKVDAQFRNDVLLLSLVSAIAVLLTLVPGTLYIEKLVRAVRKTTDAANEIAKGDYSARIDYAERDEIGALCTAVHDMADEISTADKMKNEFISTVSHELRTPLTAIRGWGETLRQVGADDPALTERGMDVILKETTRLGGMVEELLDFSRIQNDRLSLRIAQLDVVRELDEAVVTFRERAARESKQLLYAPSAAPAPMLGDADRITQVFVNVIDNALKYTDAGGTIRIEASAAERRIVIRITDNGRGISARDLPHVTEKFYKADQAVRGSGIGLAVANEIVQLHKGTLEIESERGVGTTVIITLPLLGEERSLENGQE